MDSPKLHTSRNCDPVDPIRIRTKLELYERSGHTPEELATTLKLDGRRALNFIGNAYRTSIPIDEARFAPLIEYSGASPAAPYEFVNYTELGVGEQRRIAEELGQIRFRVRPEAIVADGRLFAAHFRDLPSYYIPDTVRGTSSSILLMQLPPRDVDHIQRSLAPGHTLAVPNSFAFLGYKLLESGGVEIQVLGSELYDRITDAELRTKYAGWRTALIKAFLFYVQQREELKSQDLTEAWRLKPITPHCVTLLDPTSNVSKHARINEIYRNFLAESRPGEKSLLERIETELNLVRSILIDELGYRERIDWKLEIDKETNRRRTVSERTLEIPLIPLAGARFLQSDHPLSSVFEREETPCLRTAYAVVDQLFPPDMYEMAGKHGYLNTHPVIPRPLRKPEMKEVRRHFEIAPSDSFEPRGLLVSLGLEELRCFLRGRLTSPGKYVQELLGGYHSVISKARLTGGGEGLFEIPLVEGDAYFAPIHVGDQNRHPYIRCAIKESDGTILKFVIGFKGGGSKTNQETKLYLPEDGTELPIAYNFRESQKVLGDETAPCPAPTPSLWGGEDAIDNTFELTQTLRLRHFIETHAPDLSDLVPIPIDVRRYLTLPTWKQGKTTWVPAYEYERRFLGGTYERTRDLASYVSVERCDTRLRQLVDRVFNRSEKGAVDLCVAQSDITSGLQSLFWWNNVNTDLNALNAISTGKTLSIHRLLKILNLEYRENPERADLVFRQTACRLAELVGFIHGAGGHLGGGWRKVDGAGAMGICYGGPLGMRNIDLCAGLHDFDLNRLYFPWSGASNTRDYNSTANEIAEISRSASFDLMYLAEAVGWFDLILHGRANPKLGNPVAGQYSVNQFNDVFIINEGPAGEAMKSWVAHLASNDTSLPPPDPRTLFPEAAWRSYELGQARARPLRQP